MCHESQLVEMLGSYPEGDGKPLNDFKKGMASVVSYYEDSGGTMEGY